MDDIQRKLALIDKQLTGGPANLHKRIISTCPLLFVAVGLMVGILLQNVSGPPVWFWLILLVVCAIVAVAFFAVSKRTYPAYVIAYAALVCFLCLGAIRLISFHQPESNDIRGLVGDERKLATIRGIIVTEPYISKNRDWEFARFKFTDPGSSFYLKMKKIKTVDGWAEASGMVRVQVDEPVLDLKAGDYIQAYCWLDRFKGPTNPGQFNTAKYLARKNVFVAASVKSRDSIESTPVGKKMTKWKLGLLEGSPAGIFTKLKRKLRETATRALLGDLSLEDRSRGLLQALLLGYRRDIDSSTYRAFRKTGLLHFISLSGMHLGIFMGIIWWLCKTVGLMKPARAVICMIAIGIFLLIVPPRAPTLRAAIICSVFCVSFFFRRYSNPLNTLSLAAIILLLIRPTQLFEAGWQLSFASVLGILLFCRRIHFFLYEKITGLPWVKKAPITRPFFRIISRPGPYLLRLFSTGLTAWLAGAGVLLYHFYTISPFTSIWTVVVFPLVAGILTIGYLKIILSLLLPSVAAVLGVVVTGLAEFLIWIVGQIAQLPMAQILVGHVPAALIVFYYAFILFIAFANFRRPLLKRVICTAMVLAIVAFLGIPKWQRTHRDSLVLTCLDVGHGQAILAQLPGKANIMFDVGSLHKSDIGRRVVAAFLDYAGINKIDSIIISHNDVDHINGIPEVVEHCEVGGVYANDAFFSKADQWGTAKFLAERLSKNGLKIENLKDLKINSRAKIRILWPTEEVSRNEELGDNDKSAVCLLEFAGAEILLCSDVEKFAQEELLRLFPNLKPEVVVVPHHGSVETLYADFLEKLGGDILIHSCGRRQYEKRQSFPLIDREKSFYTPEDGAVTVSVDKDGTIETTGFAKSE